MYTKECRIEQIKGWGNFPKAEGRVFRPERIRDLVELFCRENGTFLARGGGTSYGDASINGDGINIDITRLTKMLDFDPKKGILHCQSGVTLEDVIKTFLPRGWFLNVTPGTQYATIGGCVACDSHGKNWKSGSFCNFVKRLRLMLHDGSIVYCDNQNNSDLFYATFGGMGMTGIILDVQFQLKKIRSSCFDVETIQFGTLRELFDLQYESMKTHEYVFSWIDSHKEGQNMGRGVLQRAVHSVNNIFHTKNRKVSIPFYLPNFTMNKYSIKAFNYLYYTTERLKKGKKRVYLMNLLYPLNSIDNWNRIYGKKGLIEYQVVVPADSAYETFFELLKVISKSKLGSIVAAVKPLIKSKGLMSFPMNGYTLAVDFPYNQKLWPLLDKLDRIVIESGGRVYLAKDARLSAKNFREMYSGTLDLWESVREKYNVKDKFLSLMFSRLLKS